MDVVRIRVGKDGLLQGLMDGSLVMISLSEYIDMLTTSHRLNHGNTRPAMYKTI